MPDITVQSPQNFMASAAHLETWEEDLTAFLLACRTRDQDNQGKKAQERKAQEFADMLDKAQ